MQFFFIYSQILACGYIKHLVKNSCWLVQLLSLACTIKEYKALEGKERLLLANILVSNLCIILSNICVHSMFLCLLAQQHATLTYNFRLRSNIALFKSLCSVCLQAWLQGDVRCRGTRLGLSGTVSVLRSSCCRDVSS